MTNMNETKLVISAQKPTTQPELRPPGCYCLQVQRRCGVCNRDPRVQATLPKNQK